ncbi:hypothetical protein ACLKA6_000139 [Drosophila palustris]
MPQSRPGSAAWSDPWTESGTDQNSIREPDPGVSRPGPRRGSRNRKLNRPKFYSWVIPGSPGPAGRFDHALVSRGPHQVFLELSYRESQEIFH